MSNACIIFDMASGTPLMIAKDVTHKQLDDPAFNPEGSVKFIVPMQIYSETRHEDMIAMIPKELPKFASARDARKAEIQNGAPNPPAERQDDAAPAEE